MSDLASLNSNRSYLMDEVPLAGCLVSYYLLLSLISLASATAKPLLLPST